MLAQVLVEMQVTLQKWLNNYCKDDSNCQCAEPPSKEESRARKPTAAIPKTAPMVYKTLYLLNKITTEVSYLIT